MKSTVANLGLCESPYLTRRTGSRLRQLAVALAALSSLALTDLSHAAGRVFLDDFEDDTTSKWSQDDFRNKCTVVTSAADGIAGPYAGSRMVRCNWNGTVAWNDPAAYSTLKLSTNNYTDELFIRTRIRVDQNVNMEGKLLRIYYSSGGVYHDLFGAVHAGANSLTNAANVTTGALPTYWGGANGDKTQDSSSWHKVEYYFKRSTGTLKVWHDGVLIRNDTGKNFDNVKWSPFYLLSNAAAPFDSSNYVYFDNVEVFSDLGSGASGSMADASITAGGPTPLSAPHLQIVP